MKNEKKKNQITLRQFKNCMYLCIRRKAFKAGETNMLVEDRINLFLPWRSERVLKVAGERVLYSEVPLHSAKHRLLCYTYCADALKVHEPDFYRHALVLGCGGGSLPGWLLEEYPSLQVDVVDCSPEMISVCREYFLQQWEDSDRLRYFCMDAREYVQTEYRYQFIFCDLFGGTDVAPLVYERDFVKKLYTLLCEEGVLVVNCGWEHPEAGTEVYQDVFEDLQITYGDSGQTKVIVAERR